jgi:putative ABC transport system permease protein
MKHFNFYIQHALRDMTRNGRRTAFALFCVAAGVAAIVALRSLSLMIGDSLAANIAGENHADIRVSEEFDFDNLSSSAGQLSDGRRPLRADLVKAIMGWAEANNVQTTSVISDANIQVAPMDNQRNTGRPQFISSYVIDPAVYPFYGKVTALDPPGVPLAQLFTGGNDVVLSKNLADNNGIKVGDQVHVGRTTELFTVRGIAPTEAEGSMRNMLAAMFGFAYFDRAQIQILQLEDLPSEILMLAPDGAAINQLKQSLESQVPGITATTTNDVRSQNQQTADVIDRLIMVMGLAALLIGATGIIHTMLVVVGRRTLEIAVLKTLGVKGSQITLMFLVESLIMGFVGSLLGIVLGIIFSLGVRSFTQNVWPSTLTWRIYPSAMFIGVLLGVIITTVFGFLPTLAASSVRPATVLRPNDSKLPTMGCLPTALTIAVLVISVGLIAGSIIGNLIIGLIGIVVAAVLMTVVVGLLYILIALVSILPAFGNVDLKLALRSIGTHRARTASTLLALIVGIFSLSIITLMADSIPRVLNLQFQNGLGGNVMVLGLVPSLQRPFIIAQLKDKPGVRSYQQIGSYNGRLISLNGDKNFASKMPSLGIPNFGGEKFSQEELVAEALGSVSTADVTAQGYLPPVVQEGRTFTPEDSGTRNVILRAKGKDYSQILGIKPGDKVTIKFDAQELTFTIVGITDQATTGISFGVFTAPIGAFPAGMNPTMEFTLAQVDDAYLNQTLVNLAAIPGVFPFDVGFFESIIKRFLSQFTAIPTIVAVLSLFAGAVIIANTVSLATLERRRQVGIMKAVGLKGWRVLLMMVLENGMIGLLGGIFGVGIGVIGTLLLSIGSELNITQSVSWGIVGVLMALSLGISLVATLLSAWTAATEKPINVLRYE